MQIYILDAGGKTLCSMSNNMDGLKSFNFYDAKLTRSLTTPDTFEFTCIMSHANSKYIEFNNQVVFKYEDEYRLFRIIELEEAHSDAHEVNCYCEAASLELLNTVVNPTKNDSQTPRQCLNILLADTDWEIGNVDYFESKDLDFSGYGTVLAGIESAAELYEADVKYRIEYDPYEGVTGKYVDFLEHRGVNTGARLEYGVNCSNVSKKVNGDNVCTAVIPTGTDGVNILDISCTKDLYGFEKPKGRAYVCLDEVERADIANSPYHIFAHLDVESADPYELAKKSWKHLQDNKVPKIEYTFEPSILNQKVSIGDTVYCIDREMGLQLEARVSNIENYFDGVTQDSITLTNFVEKKSNIDFELVNLIQSQLKNIDLEKDIVISDKLPDVSSGKPIVWINPSDGSVVVQTWTGEEWLEHISEQFVTEVITQSKEEITQEYTMYITENTELPIYKQATEPTVAVEGQLWLDTSVEPNIWKKYTNGEWVVLTTAGVDNKAREDLAGAVADLSTAKTSLENMKNNMEEAKLEMASISSGMQDVKAGLFEVQENMTKNNEALGAAQADITQAKTDLEGVKADLIGKASQDDLDGLEVRLSTAEASVIQNNNLIASKVSKSDYEADKAVINGEITTVSERVSIAESTITQQADEIASKVSQSTYDTDKAVTDGDISGLKTRISTAESNITQNATEITSKVSKSDYETDKEEFTNTIDGLGTRVSTAESTITQQADEIASKVSKSDYQTDKTTMEGKISEAQSLITQQADQIATKVTMSEVTGAIGELRIGGRNLLRNSDEFFTVPNSDERLNSYNKLSVDLDEINKHLGEQVTLSCYVKIENAKFTRAGVEISLRTSGKQQYMGAWVLASDIANEEGISNFEGRISKTFTLKGTEYTEQVQKYMYVQGFESGTITVGRPKFEFGNKPTDWTPAPEDVNEDITSIADRVSTAESSIIQNANEIATKVSQSLYESDKSSLTERISRAESSITQNANEISTKVTMSEVTNAIDDMQIGGRNLWVWSDAVEGYESSGNITGSAPHYCMSTKIRVSAGEKITYQRWNPNGYINSSNSNRIAWYQEDGTYIGMDGVPKELNGEYYIKETFTAPDNAGWAMLGIVSPSRNDNDYKVKFERGPKATDWTPSPEDANYDDEISGLATRITSAESRIVQNAEEIATKVSTTTYEVDKSSLVGRLSNAESAISQHADEIATKVTKSEMNTAINELEIGGANILTNSSFANGLDDWGRRHGATSSNSFVTTYDGKKCLKIVGADGTNVTVNQSIYKKIKNNDNTTQTYTISALLRCDNYVAGSSKPLVGLYVDGDDASGNWFTVSEDSTTWAYLWNFDKDGKWHRVSFTFCLGRKIKSYCDVAIVGKNFTGELYATEIKLEKGDKATDWTPSPLDTEVDISGIKDRLSTAESSIIQNSNQIALKVSQATMENYVDSAISALSGDGRNMVLYGDCSSDIPRMEEENKYGTTNAGVSLTNGAVKFAPNGSGSSAVYFVGRGINNLLNGFLDDTYVMSFDAYIPSDSTLTNNKIRAILTEYDGTNYSSNSVDYFDELTPIGTNGNYTRYEVSYTFSQANPIKRYAFFQIYSNDANAYVLLDNIKIERGSTSTPFTKNPNEMTATELSDIKTRLSTAESNITQNADAISTKVSQSEYTTYKNSTNTRLSTAESTLNQQANLIATKVTQTEIDNAVGAIKIGARNVLLGTNNSKEVIGNNTTNQCTNLYKLIPTFNELAANATNITISCDWTAEKVGETDMAGKVKFQFSTNPWGAGFRDIVNLSNSTTSGHFSLTMNCTDAIKATKSTHMDVRMEGCTAKLTFKNVMLEFSSKESSWSIAPEDYVSEIGSIEGRVSTAESNITQNAKVIATKVSQSTYDTDKASMTNRISTAESTITQHASQIATKVTQTEINNAINGLTIGGRNLLPYTDFTVYDHTNAWASAYVDYGSLTIDKNTGWACLTSTATGGSCAFRQWTTKYGKELLQAGRTYTLQFEAYASSSVVLNYCFVLAMNEDGSSNNYQLSSFKPTVTTESQRFTYTWKVGSNATLRDGIGIMIGYSSANNTEVGRKLYVRNIMLEESTKPSAYTPAESDTSAQIDSIHSRITTAESNITQNANNISTKVSATTYNTDLNALKSRMSSAESGISQNAEDITARVTKSTFNSMTIGGRNLLPYTDFTVYDESNAWASYAKDYGSFSVDRSTGWGCLESVATGGNCGFRQWTSKYGTETLEPGKTYTLQFEAYASKDVTLNYCYILSADDGNYSMASFTPKITTTAQRFTYTWTVGSTATPRHNIGILLGYSSSNNTEVGRKVYVRNIMLEQSTKPSAWSPSYIEGNNAIAELQTRMDDAEVKISDSSIIATVTESSVMATLLDMKADADSLGSYATLNEVDNKIAGIDITGTIDDRIADMLEDGNSDLSIQFATKAEMTQTAREINQNFSMANGLNLIQNSTGFAKLSFWDVSGNVNGTRIATGYEPSLDSLGIGSRFHFSPNTAGVVWIRQPFTAIAGKTYTFTAYINKRNKTTTSGQNGQVYFQIQKVSTDGTATNLKNISLASDKVTSGFELFTSNYKVTADDLADGATIAVRIYGYQYADFDVAGVMVHMGSIPLQWSLASGEVANTSVVTDINGIRVNRKEGNNITGYTSITPSEFAGYYDTDSDGTFEKIFYLNEDETVTKKVRATNEITMGSIKVVNIGSGWAFVKTSN